MNSRLPAKPQGSVPRRMPAHELYPQPGAYRPPLYRPVAARQKPPIFLGLIFMFGLVCAFGMLGYMRRPVSEVPFVLVDLRAIEAQGHAVTAAKVKINGKSMGVTDSFGEWRRYLRLMPEDKLVIELVKAGQPTYHGAKTLKVPKHRKSDHDFEVKTSIEMQESAKTQAKPLVAKTSRPQPQRSLQYDETAPVIAEEDKLPPEEQTAPSALTRALTRDADDSSDATDSSMGLYFDDGLSSIALNVKPFHGIPSNLMEQRQAEVLGERLLPMLSQEMDGLGIKTEKKAPWKLHMSYIPKKDQVGYIRSQIEWQNPFGQAEKTAFMAGYAKTFEETVKAISTLLKIHMKKPYWAFKDAGVWYVDEPEDEKAFWKIKPDLVLLDTNGQKFSLSLKSQHDGIKRWKLNVGSTQPCASVRQKNRCMVVSRSMKDSAPLPGWEQKRLRIQGPIPKQSEVFVAGFLAAPVGEGLWEYWGHPGSRQKALVVHKDRIIHSEVFKDESGTLAVIRLPDSASPRGTRRI